ncbi:hypothetical protein GUJ73_25725, partial|uniref:hypothetical protein n=1 Tax=Escherichia coli TaxID=562 RepID=UPI0016A3FE90
REGRKEGREKREGEGRREEREWFNEKRCIRERGRERQKEEREMNRKERGKGQRISTKTGEGLISVRHQNHFVERQDERVEAKQWGEKKVTTG